MAIIQGTPGNDSFLEGTPADDKMYGLAGDDYLSGDAGNDRIFGGDGNDISEAGDGNDYLNGGNGNDELRGNFGNDTIYGFAGDDTLTGEWDNDTLYGGVGNDYLNGGDENDKLFGEQGKDNLDGEIGDDTLYGGEGDDQLVGHKGDDTLFGGAGNDLLDGEFASFGYADGTGDIDALFGGTGRDTFKISYIDDGDPTNSGTQDYSLIKDFNPSQDFILLTGDKSNYFLGASPQGLPQGTAIYLDQPETKSDELIAIVENKSGLNLNASHFTATVDEYYFGSQFSDRFNAGIGNDSLYGNNGDDTLYGGDGDDFFSGDDGNDTLIGGNGNDTLSGAEELTGGTGFIRGLGEIDTLTGGVGADLFFLGAVEGSRSGPQPYIYYDDGNSQTAGTNDYAIITDFDPRQDSIRLFGSANNYILRQSTGSLPAGTGIYFDKLGSEPDELIGIIQNTSPSSLNLNAFYFKYVDVNS